MVDFVYFIKCGKLWWLWMLYGCVATNSEGNTQYSKWSEQGRHEHTLHCQDQVIVFIFWVVYTQRPLRSWKFFLTYRPEIKAKRSRMINLKIKKIKIKIFIGGNGTFSHFFGKKLKKIWKKISNFFFLLKFVFLG